MLLLDDDQVRARLDWEPVLASLETALLARDRYQVPERTALDAPQGGAFLAMPCVGPDGRFGVKQVAVLPDNPRRGLPGVQAWYTLFDEAGRPALACAATLLTRLRTAAVSAVAARALAPAAPRTLLVCGAGGLAPWMAEAHLQVRPYERVVVWARRPEAARAAATEIAARFEGLPVRPAVQVAEELEPAAREADVISCATTAREPFVRGAWLREGQHLDLVGAFRHGMAEADEAAVAASDVVVDDRGAARAEAGELSRAAAGGWSWDEVRADLPGVLRDGFARGVRPTMFKSVGLALEDLAVASLLLES